MLRICYRGMAVAGLAMGLCLPALAQQGSMSGERSAVAGARATMAGGRSSYAMANTHIDWSRRYELTPVEMKRLRAMGLSEREIFAIANGARMTGMPVDSLAQRIFRGETAAMMARNLNVSEDELTRPDPMWQTPEWEQAVREGLWYVPGGGTRGSMGEGRGMRSGARGGAMERTQPRRTRSEGTERGGRRNRDRDTEKKPDYTR